MDILLRTVRVACVAAFVIVGAATLVVAVVETLGLCPGFSANTGLTCGGAWYEGIANKAFGIVLLSLATIIPSVMAIAGLIFVILVFVRRCRRDSTPAEPGL
jgi:uncharacterized membrane protein